MVLEYEYSSIDTFFQVNLPQHYTVRQRATRTNERTATHKKEELYTRRESNPRTLWDKILSLAALTTCIRVLLLADLIVPDRRDFQSACMCVRVRVSGATLRSVHVVVLRSVAPTCFFSWCGRSVLEEGKYENTGYTIHCCRVTLHTHTHTHLSLIHI